MRKYQVIRSALRSQKIRGEILLSKQPQDYKVQESTNCPDHPHALKLLLLVKEERPRTSLVLSSLKDVPTDVIAGISMVLNREQPLSQRHINNGD